MEFTIKIDKTDVMAEVDRTSAYIGAKTLRQDGGNMYNHISTIREDAGMLQRYWKEACSDVAAVCRDFTKGTDCADDITFILIFDMPEDFNTSLTGVLLQYIYSYIVSYVIMQWLRLCGVNDRLEAYAATVANGLGSIVNVLHSRKIYYDRPYGSGDNVFGRDMPQNFGETKVTVYKKDL